MNGEPGPGVEPLRLDEWIASRRPPVPGAFAPWVRPARAEAPAGVDALVAEAHEALRRAESPEGRPRGGAFDLLAADGFATWACEAALESDEPDTALRAVLDALLE